MKPALTQEQLKAWSDKRQKRLKELHHEYSEEYYKCHERIAAKEKIKENKARGTINKPGEAQADRKRKEKSWEKDWKKFNTKHRTSTEKKKLETAFNKDGEPPDGL